MDSLRILLVYPGPTHSTYDVAVGYDTALTMLGHRVISWMYHSFINFYAQALDTYDGDKEMLNPFKLASEHLVITAIDTVPDVCLIIAGGALHRRAYDLLHQLNIPIVLLLTESPYQDDKQIVYLEKGHVRAALTNEKNSVKPLSEAGVPVHYLPHSFDPLRHFTAWEPDPEYRKSVVFFGTLWEERAALLKPLYNLPNTLIGGYEVLQAPGNISTIDNADLARYYRGSKICLNHHRTTADHAQHTHIGNGEAYSIGPRAYEIAACGGFQLSDDTRGELFDIFDDSVATYRNAAHLQAQVDYYLRHEDERRDMALDAWDHVQACTFSNRAVETLIPVLQEVLQ